MQCNVLVLMRMLMLPLPRVALADRMVIDRDCVVALPCRVEDARPSALGDEIPRAVDVAVGPSFRSAHQFSPLPLPPLLFIPPPFFFFSPPPASLTMPFTARRARLQLSQPLSSVRISNLLFPPIFFFSFLLSPSFCLL